LSYLKKKTQNVLDLDLIMKCVCEAAERRQDREHEEIFGNTLFYDLLDTE